uniref:Odorant receptor n=1 Tax=Conogethes punctiferalis TaxID=1133088 RepID=A0A1Y9TJJ5_CONPF|nr:odorant receptor 50 [Conogethes punctiferalis]
MLEKLKRFGLGHCDLPTLLWNVAFMLKGLMLNIDKRYMNRIPTILYIINVILAVSYLYTYFFSMIWFVFVRCVQTKDLAAAMIVFSLGITSEIGVAKFINTYIYRDEIRNLLQDCLELDSTTVSGSRYSMNLLQTLRTVKKRALTYWIIIISNGVLYILKPIVMPGRTAMEDVFILYKLEPEFETPNYELAYFLSATGSVLTCYLTSNMAAFLIIVAGYLEAQLHALSEELYNLWDDAELEYLNRNFSADIIDVNDVIDEKDINRLIHIKLRDITIAHTKTITLMLKLDDIFRISFAFEFFILSIGLIAELLGGLDKTYMQVPFAIIQVGMDCLTGQRVIDASNTFENAVYACNWERFDSSNMKTVLVILINAQKTLSLSAGGIAILSFATLMSVFKSIYSAFTTLQSMM